MSLNKQQLATELGDILEVESLHLNQMLVLLEQERNQIISNPEALTAIASEKHKQVQLLEQQTLKHNKLLQQAGFDLDQSGMKKFIECCGSPQKLIYQWETLLNAIADCQESNLKNGALVELSRNRLSQLADIFQGDEKQTSTYDQSGKNNKGHIPGSVSLKV